MKISIYYSGDFGKKVIGNLVNSSTFCTSCGELCDHCREEKASFAGDIVDIHEFPQGLPQFIEEPLEYLPVRMGECDLIIAMDLHPDILSLLPEIVRHTNARAVIAPVEDPTLAPAGLVEQLRKQLEDMQIQCEFPRPFCELQKTGKNYIDEFVDMGFGRPIVKMNIDTQMGNFGHIHVIRDAPCGSTWYVAKQLSWTDLKDYKETISSAHHAYPCTASMKNDPSINDTLLHKAGYIIRESVEAQMDKE